MFYVVDYKSIDIFLNYINHFQPIHSNKVCMKYDIYGNNICL